VPQTYRYLLHSQGPSLWPSHKPVPEIMDLKAVTPSQIFETTYQLNAVIPGGTIFKLDWYADGANRYHPRDPRYLKGRSNGVIRRWMSCDTAHTATKKGWEESQQTAAYSAFGIWDLLNDYRVALRAVWRERLEFPDLVPDPRKGTKGAIADMVEAWYDPEIFAGVLIENADSGVSAIQTLKRSSFPWAGNLIIPFDPEVDKVSRAITASVWFQNGSVLLPFPDVSTASWQLDYEKELFGFPNTAFKDQVDMTSQMIIQIANRYLSVGWQARQRLRHSNIGAPVLPGNGVA
jgi:predicted phage terminase large subunit-like protein